MFVALPQVWFQIIDGGVGDFLFSTSIVTPFGHPNSSE